MPTITGADIVNTAERYSGIKYFEGNPQSPQNGFDCSGIVQRVMADLGVSIPRTTSEQLAAAATGVGQNIGTNLSNALQGDILHYVGHEEIWIGGGMVFSEATNGTVASVRKRTPWPIIGIIRYANGGPGPQVGSLGQTKPGQTTSEPAPTGGDPGQVQGPFSQIDQLIPGLDSVISFVQAFSSFIGDVTNGGFWKRVGLGFLGAMLLLVGLYAMANKGQTITIQNAASVAGKAVKSASTS